MFLACRELGSWGVGESSWGVGEFWSWGVGEFGILLTAKHILLTVKGSEPMPLGNGNYSRLLTVSNIAGLL